MSKNEILIDSKDYSTGPQ